MNSNMDPNPFLQTLTQKRTLNPISQKKTKNDTLKTRATSTSSVPSVSSQRRFRGEALAMVGLSGALLCLKGLGFRGLGFRVYLGL